MKKTILCTLSAAAMLLSSCMAVKGYSDTESVFSLAEEVFEELGREHAFVLDKTNFTDDYFKLPDYVRAHAVYYTPESDTVDEIGIYHVTDGNAEKMKALLEKDYLAASYEKNREWYDSYIPKETPKLRDSEVKIFGNYVIYAILSAPDRSTAFNAAKEELSEE